MACTITYDNKQYTQKEFEQYFKEHFTEFVDNFLGSKQDIEGFKEFVNTDNQTTQSYQPNKDINFNLTNLNFTPEVLQHLYKQSKKTKTFEEYSKIIQLVATNLMATDLTNEEIIDKLTCI